MKSIRSKIMWLLFCSVLISSLIIGALGISLTADVIKDSSTENMRLLCKNNADKVDITFAKIEESVNTLAHFAKAELPDVDSLKNADVRKNFSASVRNNALHHVESIDGAAAVYMHYSPELINTTDGFFYAKLKETDTFKYHPLTDVTDLPNDSSGENDWWYIPTTKGEPTWTEAFYDKNLDRYVVSYVVPIYKNQKLVGAIGADIFTEHIEHLVKEVSIFNSGQGAILKSDGTVMYHPNFERGMLIGEGDPGFAGVIDKLKSQDSTKELISYQLKGEKKRLASCKLRNGMLLICFAPESEIFYKQNMLMLVNIILTCVVVIIASILAFLVSKRLTRPIKKLNEAAKHLTDGEFDFDIQTETYDEIGELTKTFIETRKILRQQIHLLDKEAHIDGLTGVGNKSAFMDKEAEINQKLLLNEIDFSLVVFDVNKLKIANDIFGHLAGDKLIQTVAGHLSENFGSENVYRMGGDEFVVIIIEDEKTDSATKIHSCIEELKILSVEGFPDCKVSCAYGFSRFDSATDHQLSDVLRRADKGMYKNKTETKKEAFPWQQGSKGIKQLQIDKYCDLLQSLNDSTDDYLFLMNIETGFLRFFGGNNSMFNISENQSDSLEALLKYVHINDHALLKNSIISILNRDVESIDITFRTNNNNMRWVNCRANVIKDEMDAHFVLIGRISQNAVKHLYNPITTLFNKVKLKADLKENLAVDFDTLMLIEIDKLSEITLNHGSVYSENLLKMLAEELEKRFSIRQIYHCEKDRFALLLNTKNNQDATEIFEALKETVYGTCSISASVVPNDSTLYISKESIYDYAVQMLTHAKDDGALLFFSKESMLERISAVELLEELEENVKNNCEGFSLVYQPQINAENYSIISAEALLRFESATRGRVYPNQFIPLLEQSGLIKAVGMWVTNEALSKCKKWREFNPDLKISVNISPRQLEDKEIATQIVQLLRKYNLPPEALILEITESTQLDANTNVFDVLTQLRNAGIQIAIDDFGTGYSNLGNLKHIQANILKVDRIFIRDIKENGYNYNLIYNVLEFAKSNSLKVCLEGVETKEELLVLSGLQPDIFQGYLFDKPCPAEALEAKYFAENSPEYTQRTDHFEQLIKERKNSPIVNMEMKTILSGLNIGLWIIRSNPQTGEGELYADTIMRKLLGIEQNLSPSECYNHWRSNIKPEYIDTVDAMVNEMSKCESVVQAEYLWHHPTNGEILVRCSGRCTDKSDDAIVFEGFHRIISDLGKIL